MGLQPSGLIAFRVPGNAVPKARPRIANGRAYTPARTAAWEAHVAQVALLAYRTDPDPHGTYRMVCDFRLKGARRRVDLDNLVKAILDALNALIWTDDEQVFDLRATKAFNTPDPHVNVLIERLEER